MPGHLTALLLCLLTALPAAAQLRLPMPPLWDDHFPAIGRTFDPDNPEGGFCSGALIAPDLILTAAHCAYRKPTTHVFVFGDPEDPATLRHKIAGGHKHPSYIARGVHGPAQDLGFIILADPVDTKPLPLGPLTGDTFAIIGYHRAFPHTQTGRFDCPLEARRLTHIRLGCYVVSGNSGSPILQKTVTGWQIVAVASSQAGDSALAPELDQWAKDIIAAHPSK